MSLSDEIEERVKKYLNAGYETTRANIVPDKSSIAFGKNAKEMKAKILCIDIRSSKKILSETGAPLESCKVHKAFLYVASKCIRKENGYMRNFSGDGLIAFFMGEDGAKRAVKSAMKIKYAVNKILNPALEEREYKKLDFGIGVATGDFTVVKSGVAGDEMHQDLIWICWATYHAVEYANKAKTPKNIWISNNVFNEIKGDDSMRYNKGKPMWSYADEKFSFGKTKVYKTTYRWSI